MRSRRLAGAVAALAITMAGCGDDDAQETYAPLQSLLATAEQGRWRSTGDQVVEVFVCRVHPYTAAPIYGGLPLRAPIAPATLASQFQQSVTRYYHRISHGAYQPVFVVGGEITLGIADDEHDCIDEAIAASASTTDVVLAVADAEHAPDQPGGLGSGGDPASPEGPATATRRYAYVGAADFDRTTWGDAPPMDMVEHELGHTLGWVHSGVTEDGQYLSGLDLMSDSAAPRSVDPARRDGPDVLAVHRLMAGWMPMDAVVVADGDAAAELLAPSTGDDGTRLLVLPIDEHTFLTIELLTADGYDDHLPHDGLAVHRVRERDGLITSIEPLVGEAPFLQLMQPGDSLTADGWTIDVAADGRVLARTAG